MRLFVAVEIDARLAASIAAAGDELRRRAAGAAPNARITWIPADRMHLTVRFIGEVDDARASAIRAALDAPLATPAFGLTIAGLGAFPPSGAPRVLWAAVTEGKADMQALEREVGDRLAACGIAREDRPYRPHLTLARVRDAAGLRARPLLSGWEERSMGTTHVDAITLFQSRLSPKGPAYVALQRTALSY